VRLRIRAAGRQSGRARSYPMHRERMGRGGGVPVRRLGAPTGGGWPGRGPAIAMVCAARLTMSGKQRGDYRGWRPMLLP